MYTLTVQRWVGGRSFKVARRVALDQNGNSRTLHARPCPPPPTGTMLDCAFHTSAIRSSPHSCSETPPARPGERIFLLFFFKAAELKRFRSHPLSSAVNPGTSRTIQQSVSVKGKSATLRGTGGARAPSPVAVDGRALQYSLLRVARPASANSLDPGSDSDGAARCA